MNFPRRGDVSELAEGARLEIVYMCKTRILGSNPSISAIPLFEPSFPHKIL
jgi:hypothetical protein